jgi:hypothetical protein
MKPLGHIVSLISSMVTSWCRGLQAEDIAARRNVAVDTQTGVSTLVVRGLSRAPKTVFLAFANLEAMMV